MKFFTLVQGMSAHLVLGTKTGPYRELHVPDLWRRHVMNERVNGLVLLGGILVLCLGLTHP